MNTRYDDLEGKNILVTGGTSGLGYAIAGAFAACRSRVMIIGRDAGRLSRAGKQMGGHVVSRAFDLSDIDGLPDMVEEIRQSMGEIDVLVNNAGINLKKDALAVSNREYTDIILTNQTSVFAMTREIGRHMIARRSGAIVMISSMASRYGIPGVIAYTASKAAVEGMTRALAVEWSPFGVRVNCIAPGFIDTPMSARALDTDAGRKSRVLARTPMGKLGEPADIAEAALFLSSARARYITGVVLPVDGGNSIGF